MPDENKKHIHVFARGDLPEGAVCPKCWQKICGKLVVNTGSLCTRTLGHSGGHVNEHFDAEYLKKWDEKKSPIKKPR